MFKIAIMVICFLYGLFGFYIAWNISHSSFDASVTYTPLALPQETPLYEGKIIQQKFYAKRNFFNGVFLKAHDYFPQRKNRALHFENSP